MDEKLVSSWYIKNQSLPENYVHPTQTRPGKELEAPCKTIPVVDLGLNDRSCVIREILEACHHFGFFQVINHGVCEDLMEDAMSIFKEFHAMPAKEKIKECSKDPNNNCRVYTSSENYTSEEVHYWKDTIRHPCHPVDDCVQFWPARPIRYQEVVRRYTIDMRELSLKILEIIAEGLGLSHDYFCGALIDSPILAVHHYSPCPDPTLTLGLPRHRDPSLITILMQDDVKGLQVFKDGDWISVDPVPYAFVVNIGYILQVVSNGKLIGAEHRVVTNSKKARTTAAYLTFPSKECNIEPEKALVTQPDQSLYRTFKYKEFYDFYMANNTNAERVNNFVSNKATQKQERR